MGPGVAPIRQERGGNSRQLARCGRWAALLLFLFLVPAAGAVSGPCEGLDTVLLVDTDSHSMWMCSGSEAVASFPVALGRGGVDKRVRGDRKTPRGRYELGQPRPSQRYGQFIPVGYPNSDEALRGFSGGSIGIHGPHRSCLWIGKDSTNVDWTYGCIAVATDDEIEIISQWIRDSSVSRIIIR